MRNPDWNREEIILALDLYFNLDYGQMHGRHPLVIKLSDDLRRMKIHKSIPDPKSFRSVNSVALKLNNLKKWDQNFSGKGMKDGGKLDGEIWKEFYRHRDTLRREALSIRFLHQGNENDNSAFSANEKKALLFKIHKARESDPVSIKIKLEIYSDDRCEVCGFRPAEFYGEMGSDILEVHYSRQMNNLPGMESVEISDFTVVCPNCHSMLDKHYAVILPEDLKILIGTDNN